jgi:RNA polymerase sigma-70 factor (ECF subfamily)
MNVPSGITANHGHLWTAAPPFDEPPADLVALVTRAKSGDREAYTILYRRYLDDVYRFALVRLGSREAAEDATQTVFVRALSALPTCRENAAFVGWLFAIARSVVGDQMRARRHQTDPIPDDARWVDAGPGPEEVVMQGEVRRFLLAARERCLTAGERELFDLLLTELNDKQIATALGRSHGAVRTAHWRLLSKLRACLKPLAGASATGPAHA